MSFKKKRKCSRLEHHEGDHPLGESDEKLPMEIGDLVVTNMVSVTILHCFSIQPDFSIYMTVQTQAYYELTMF